MAAYIIMSFAATYLAGTPTDSVVSSVITVQAILAGFGFSVLFFLVSSEQEDESSTKSIEDSIRKVRLNKLTTELFYNISYYNVVTISSVIVALFLSFNMPDFRVKILDPIAFYHVLWHGYPNFTNIINYTFDKIVAFIHIFVVVIFYFLCIDSVYTFYRIIFRVNFYFLQKRKISPGSD